VKNIDASSDRPPEVETVRVWNLSRSETTGRVIGTRKAHQHLHEGTSESPREEEPSTGEDFSVPTDQEPSEQPAAKPAAKRKRVRIRKENDSVSLIDTSLKVIVLIHQQTRMEDWLMYLQTVLDELLRKDSLGDSATPGMCVGCRNVVGEYRCRDCLGGSMRCLECAVSFHRELPLHRLQVCPKLPVSWLRYINFHCRSGRTAFSGG